MQRSPTSRRRFLRGLGVTLALPWMETPQLRAERATSSAANRSEAKRFACLFMANGVNPADWGAEGSGDEMVLKKSLQPLEPLKEQLLVLNGLYNPNAAHGNIHVAAAPNILSGARVLASTTDLKVATSFDQELAKHIGEETEFPSLALGIEPPYLGTHKGYSCIYCSHISWSSATTPVPRENNPRALYDRMVSDPRGHRHSKSVLDLVLDDAKSMLPRLSSWDRQRFNDYLTSVREVEKRLERVPSTTSARRSIRDLMQPPPTSPPPAIADHMRLMLDLLAMSFATDATRVATLMFNNDLSKMDFGFLNSSSTALTNMHTMSHAGGKDYSTMNHFHVEMYAHFLKRLHEFPEGEASVLDNSCIMFCSSLMSGGAHDRRQMPVVLAGKLGGRLKTGRTVNYMSDDQQADGRRRICNLYAKLFQHYGIERDSFGDSTQPLRDV